MFRQLQKQQAGLYQVFTLGFHSGEGFENNT